MSDHMRATNQAEALSWLTWFETNNFKDLPIVLKAGGKNPARAHKGGQWTADACRKETGWDMGEKGVGFLLTDLFVLDFDDVALFEEYRSLWAPHLDECALQKTKHGYHCIWKRCPALDDATHQNGPITDKARGLVVDGKKIDIDIKTVTASFIEDSNHNMRATSGVLVVASPKGNTDSNGNVKKQWVRDPREVGIAEVPAVIVQFLLAHYKGRVKRTFMGGSDDPDRSRRANKKAREMVCNGGGDWGIVSHDGDSIQLGMSIDEVDIAAIGFEDVRVLGQFYTSKEDGSHGYRFTFRKDINCPLCNVKHNGNNAWVQYSNKEDEVGERIIKGFSDNCIKHPVTLKRSPAGLKAWHDRFSCAMEDMTEVQVSACTRLHASLRECKRGWMSPSGGSIYLKDPADDDYFFFIPTMNTANGTLYRTAEPWRGPPGATNVPGDISTSTFAKVMSVF